MFSRMTLKDINARILKHNLSDPSSRYYSYQGFKRTSEAIVGHSVLHRTGNTLALFECKRIF